jgi:Tfp pilus assembly protein PilO
MIIEKRSLEISILSIVLTFLLIWFGLRPVVGKLHEQNVSLARLKEEYTQKQTKLDTLSSMKSRLASLKSDLELMQKALPKGEDIPGLLVSTESLVGNSGLALTSFSPPASGQASSSTTTQTTASANISPTVTQATGISSLSYSLSLQGGYPQFITFLQNVEKNLRPTSVVSINIAGGGGDNMSYSVNMVSYYQQ